VGARASCFYFNHLSLSQSRDTRIIEGVGGGYNGCRRSPFRLHSSQAERSPLSFWPGRVALRPRLASTATAHARTAAASTSTSSARVACLTCCIRSSEHVVLVVSWSAFSVHVVPSRRGTGILNLSTSCSKFSTFAASGALKVQETKGVVSHLAAGSGKGNVPFFLDPAYPVYPQPVGILRKFENSKIRKTKT
jgi:hypothetical protein